MKPTRNHLVSLLIAVMIVGVQFAWHTTEAQASSASAGTGPTTYFVKKGDTLTSIAKRYGVTIQAIAKLNGIKSTSKILVGQKLHGAEGLLFKPWFPHEYYLTPFLARRATGSRS